MAGRFRYLQGTPQKLLWLAIVCLSLRQFDFHFKLKLCFPVKDINAEGNRHDIGCPRVLNSNMIGLIMCGLSATLWGLIKYCGPVSVSEKDSEDSHLSHIL